MGGKQRSATPAGLEVEEVYRKMRALASGGAGVGAALESAGPGPEPRLRQLAEGIWVIALRTPTLPPATTTNCYLIGDRELVIIDPATPHPSEKAALDEALGELEAAGRRPVAIWLTHHHGDHVADAARLAAVRNIPVAAHPETAARLPAIPVTATLNDGDRRRFAASAITLRAVFTPGHAAGHLCFVEESSRLCVAGDMVAGVGSILIDPAEGDMSVYLASLRRLGALDLAGLLPAHGPVLPDAKAALFGYVAHRLWREARVIDALTESARGVGELLSTVYADVAPMLYPLAARSLLAHLIKLERDQLATRTDDAGQSWKKARS